MKAINMTGVSVYIHTLSSSTRSMRFLPRGLMSLRMRAMTMSMPLDSWLAMAF